MLKKIIVTTLVVIVMVSMLAIPANAIAMSESDRPTGVIGIELLKKLQFEHEDEGIPFDYTITMYHVDDAWIVMMKGETEAFEDYGAVGCYDHYPTEAEINVLWANRLITTELDEIIDAIG